MLVQDEWVSAFDCTFADSEIGLHLNINGGNPMDSRCMGDAFRNNGTDTENRCGRKPDTSEAVFA